MYFAFARSSYVRHGNAVASILNYNKRFGLLRSMPPITQTTIASSDSCSGGSSTGKSKHQITFQPYQPPPALQHDYKNMALNRPMSPHLTIVAPTVTAATSIFQRITGIILVFYAVMLSGGSLFLSNGVETYVSMIQSLDLNRLSILLIKLILGVPFAFHYFNGIRFCMWNAGKWLAMKEVYDTAKKCIIATAVLTVLFALI